MPEIEKKPGLMKHRAYRLPEWAIKLVPLLGSDASSGIRIALSGLPLMFQAMQYIGKMQARDPEADKLYQLLGRHYESLLNADIMTKIMEIEVLDDCGRQIKWLNAQDLLADDDYAPILAKQVSKNLTELQTTVNKKCRDKLIVEQFGAIAQAVNNLAASLERS
jgi:hypothetical protein